MKKTILLFAIIISVLSFGQFNITAEGYRNIEDTSKDYIVLDFPEKSKQELFIAAKKVINSTFENINSKLYTEIENEQITFSAFSRNSQLIMLNFAGSNIYHLYNKYELNFKDGKVMVKPIYQYLTNLESNQEHIRNLFKRKENKLNKATAFINQETNTFAKNLQHMLTTQVNSDW